VDDGDASSARTILADIRRRFYKRPYEYACLGAPRLRDAERPPRLWRHTKSLWPVTRQPVSTDDPTTTGRCGLPPHWGDDGDNTGSHFFETRLRRARLGLFVGLSGIAMIFISSPALTSVRQGLPTLDHQYNVLLHDGFRCHCPVDAHQHGCTASVPSRWNWRD